MNPERRTVYQRLVDSRTSREESKKEEVDEEETDSNETTEKTESEEEDALLLELSMILDDDFKEPITSSAVEDVIEDTVKIILLLFLI